MPDNERPTASELETDVRMVPASLTLVALLFFGGGLLGASSFVEKIANDRIIDLFGCLVSLALLYVGWGLLREWPVARTSAKLLLAISFFFLAVQAFFVAVIVLGYDQVFIGGSDASVSGSSTSSGGSVSSMYVSFDLVNLFLPTETIELNSLGAKLLCLAIGLAIVFAITGIFFWMLRVLKEPQVVSITDCTKNTWTRSCPECGSGYGWLDLLTQPSICRNCWRSR